ncbi:hypothetical protein BU23DRAFT_22358 [Bimuria novae-zelandiae CBS 107.79]|uniref:Uncharacterized protein n=1 Tax=Bimuria novae-zelandiae CBS 107.79 TaxID=1447943 RepID=A0A6A5UP79_9PLEO|nr:hypothetical protein BU23DRAFT_22358 [Bimuria novae-zelandiae CBS 107.79]
MYGPVRCVLGRRQRMIYFHAYTPTSLAISMRNFCFASSSSTGGFFVHLEIELGSDIGRQLRLLGWPRFQLVEMQTLIPILYFSCYHYVSTAINGVTAVLIPYTPALSHRTSASWASARRETVMGSWKLQPTARNAGTAGFLGKSFHHAVAHRQSVIVTLA